MHLIFTKTNHALHILVLALSGSASITSLQLNSFAFID